MEEPDYKSSKKTSSKNKQKQKDEEEVPVDVIPKDKKKKPKKKTKKDRMQPLPPTPEEVEKARKKAIRVLFLHGLESGPRGVKARMLDPVFTLFAPDMSPNIQRMISYHSPYLQMIAISLALTLAISIYLIYWGASMKEYAYIAVGIVVILIELVIVRYLIQSNVATCMRECVELQTEAINKFEPDVVVASSFGGGVAVHLLSRGIWKGATLLLAPAQHAISRRGFLTGHYRFSIPPEATVTVVHGKEDNVIPLSDSETLANLGSHEQVEFITVTDDHRLSQTLKKKRMEELVLQVHAKHLARGGEGHHNRSDRSDSTAGLLTSAN
eukprot:TRINITY_DN2366_c0_g1_i2.p1 TRINITY_DN2366_c0_g1~~TRINITY_DN2366_c0_g1_i2.p1  ORF type:complete len:326 (+),score=40.74 TRINITY_DN2366_c0_g1_i2:90-1067(+)